MSSMRLKNQQLEEERRKKEEPGFLMRLRAAKPAATSAYLWSSLTRDNHSSGFILHLCYMWNAFPDDMPLLWLDLDLTHSVYIRKTMQFPRWYWRSWNETSGNNAIVERERETSVLAFNIRRSTPRNRWGSFEYFSFCPDPCAPLKSNPSIILSLGFLASQTPARMTHHFLWIL